MGYSKSLRALQRVRNYLDEMVSSEGKLTWLHSDPPKLSFWIREGIQVARRHALDKDKKPVEPYAAYARLLSKYVIRMEGNKVIADPRDVIPMETVRESLNKMVLHGVNDEFSIMGAAIMHKAEELFFPDATDETCDLAALYNWTSKNGYNIIPSEDGITLTRRDVGDIAWKA